MVKTTFKILGVIFALGLVFMISALLLSDDNKSLNSDYTDAREKFFEKQDDMEAFNFLSVDTAACDVKIIEGDSYGFEAQNMYGAKIIWSLDNGVLSIREDFEKNLRLEIGNLFAKEDNYVKVFVPKEDRLKDASIDVSSGDVYLNQMKLEMANLNLTSGNAQVRGCDIDSFKVDSTSGDIDIEDSVIKSSDFALTSGSLDIKKIKADTINVKSYSGDFELDGEVNNSVRAKLTSGDTVLTLKGNEEDYSYDLRTLSGKIEIGNNEFGNKVNIQKGENKLSIEATSGDIDILFS